MDGKDWNEVACANNNYAYGRAMNGHIGGLLNIFRLTGDLRLLKEVDRLMELAKSQLGTFNGSSYKQWKLIVGAEGVGSTTEWRERFLDDVLTHAMVARVAAALQENAGVAGTSFGAHARFWKTYLLGSGPYNIDDGYEAKWKQERNGVFPFIAGAPYGLNQTSGFKSTFGPANLAHIYMNHIIYLHYAGKLTGSSSYTNEVNEMISYWTRLKVDTVVDAYVWPHATIMPDADEASTSRLTFAPIVYSGTTINGAIDLALDGQAFFDSETKMARFSRTVSYHVLDQGQFDGGDLEEPYRGSVGSNRTNWTDGNACDKSMVPQIYANTGDECIDIGGVRYFNGTSGNVPALYTGAYNTIGAWPKKSSLAALESSKIYTFHDAARDNSTQRQKDALRYQGLKSFIFTRLWVEGGYTLN